MAKSPQTAARKPTAKVAVSPAPSRPAVKVATKAAKKDNFAVYVVLATISVLILCAAVYFYLHALPSYESKQNYQVLPQLVYENDGQVVQLQVNIQVKEKDKDWLDRNVNSINEIFVKTIQKIDPATFRTEEGSEAVLVQLKDAINAQMNTTKVEAVLYKDMVIQHKVE